MQEVAGVGSDLAKTVFQVHELGGHKRRCKGCAYMQVADNSRRTGTVSSYRGGGQALVRSLRGRAPDDGVRPQGLHRARRNRAPD